MSSSDSLKPKTSVDESVASTDEFESAFDALLSEDDNSASNDLQSQLSDPDEIFDVDEVSQIFQSGAENTASTINNIELDTQDFGSIFEEPLTPAEVTESKAKVLDFNGAENHSAKNPDELSAEVASSIDDINAAIEALDSLEISSDELLTADAISNPFIEEDTVNEEDYNECYNEAVEDDNESVQVLDSDFDIDYFTEESFKDLTLKSSFLYKFAKRFSPLYILVTAVFSLVGFAYFAAYPVALVYVSFNGFEMLNSPLTGNAPMLVLAMFSFSLLIFMMFWKLTDIKFAEPQGLTLDEENAAELLEHIQSYKSEFRIPKIHKVILTRRHELTVIKVPRLGIPFWSKNVLAIGYPLLQTLTPEYFDCALKRRLLQYSKRSNMLINWLSLMRNTWVLYSTSLKKRRHFLDLIHYCFFAIYAPLYRNFAVYIAQRDELFADAIALRHCNDRDLIKTLATTRITKAMLVQYYWPKLKSEMRNNHIPPSELRPYENMTEVLDTLLSNEKTHTWFIRLAMEESSEKTPDPAFSERMKRMGYSKIYTPDPIEETAAEHFFGEEESEITMFMDELWALQVDREVFLKNIKKNEMGIRLPSHASLPSN